MNGFDPKEASAKGIAVRQDRAALKRQLASGERDFLTTFDLATDGSDPIAAGIRTETFLRCIPAVGRTKAQAALERIGVSPRATIGKLRINQRTAFRRELVRLTERLTRDQHSGLLVVIAGPTAVGKATVIRAIRQMRPEYELSVSATTRKRRPGERDGRDYFFLTDDQFDQMIRRRELLEWATVHGTHRYGTPRDAVRRQQQEGKTVLLEIDLQGARQVRASGEPALFIFLAPPSFNALIERLESRGTEDEDERRRRLATAVEELAAQDEFDFVVVNDLVDDAAANIVDLISRHQLERGDA